MEAFFINIFSWGDLLFTGLLLLAIYLTLRATAELLQRTVLPRPVWLMLRHGLRWVTQFFEPVALLILLVIFVFIRPAVHGPVVALLILVGFRHVRNYFSGHIVLFYENLTAGSRLRTESGHEGVVTRLGRMGLQLRTSEGLHYVNYCRLLAQGYTQVTGEEVGGFHLLLVSPKVEEKNVSKLALANRLHDLLARAPFLNPRHRPEVSQNQNVDGHFTTKVLVDEEHHLNDLLALFDEQGWQVQASNFALPTYTN